MKDKRIKGCPNPECDKNAKKFRYKSDDTYCTHCGQGLVFVCAKCFKKIDHEGVEHKICAHCEAATEQRKAGRADVAKKVGTGVLGVGGAVLAFTKSGGPAKIAKAAAQILRH